MRVSELWRYPVKSLRGEPVEESRITALGIEGGCQLLLQLIDRTGADGGTSRNVEHIGIIAPTAARVDWPGGWFRHRPKGR